MTTLHELKTEPNAFKQVWQARKTFDLRKDDRKFNVSDVLHLREYELLVPQGKPNYTGKSLLVLVLYVLRDAPDWGLKDGYVAMGIKLLARLDNGQPTGM
jgi:hypothetical protein